MYSFCSGQLCLRHLAHYSSRAPAEPRRIALSRRDLRSRCFCGQAWAACESRRRVRALSRATPVKANTRICRPTQILAAQLLCLKAASAGRGERALIMRGRTERAKLGGIVCALADCGPGKKRQPGEMLGGPSGCSVVMITIISFTSLFARPPAECPALGPVLVFSAFAFALAARRAPKQNFTLG